MIKMKDLLVFIKNFEKIIFGIGFKLILKRIKNERALIRVNAGAGAANDCNTKIREIPWCVPRLDPSNENRIIV